MLEINCVCSGLNFFDRPRPVRMEPGGADGDYFIGTDSDFERWVAETARKTVEQKIAAQQAILRGDRTPELNNNGDSMPPRGSQQSAKMGNGHESIAKSNGGHGDDARKESLGMKREHSGQPKENVSKAHDNGLQRSAQSERENNDDGDLSRNGKRSQREPSSSSVGPSAPPDTRDEPALLRRKNTHSDDEISVLAPNPTSPDMAAVTMLETLKEGVVMPSQASLKPSTVSTAAKVFSLMY